MVAIMRDKKGHEDLIAAAEPLFATRPNLHIVMAGDGDTFARIKALVERRGLAQRIHLLGFRTDIPNVLRGCDLFVLPTHQEALGQSYIEAMAAGLPVIGTQRRRRAGADHAGRQRLAGAGEGHGSVCARRSCS